ARKATAAGGGGQVEYARSRRQDEGVDPITATGEGECIIAELDPVVADTAIGMVCGREHEDVVAAFAIEAVIPGAADEGVDIVAANQKVVAGGPFDPVLAVVAGDPVEAVEAHIGINAEAKVDDAGGRASSGMQEAVITSVEIDIA